MILIRIRFTATILLEVLEINCVECMPLHATLKALQSISRLFPTPLILSCLCLCKDNSLLCCPLAIAINRLFVSVALQPHAQLQLQPKLHAIAINVSI